MPNRPELQDKGPGAASHKDKPLKIGTSHKGISKKIRANKRSEAEERQLAEHMRVCKAKRCNICTPKETDE